MSLSRSVRRSLLNHLFGKITYTRPTNIFVGISSTLPTSTGNNVTEPLDVAYARKSTAPADWDVATDADPAAVINNVQIDFAIATADWLSGVLLPYVVLYDAVSGGSFLGYGEFSRPKSIYIDDQMSIKAGRIIVGLV